MKVLFTYNYGKELMNRIEALGYEIIYASEKNVKYIEEFSDVEVLVCYNPFITLDIRLMKELKFIQLSSTGFDQIPEYIDENIVIANNHGGYSIPIGEWTVHKILEIYKDARCFYENQKKKTWKLNKNLLELKDKKIAFLGTGTLASESAKRLQGFDMNIIGFSKSGKQKQYFDKVFTMDCFEDMISNFDILILALPYTNETYHFMSDNYIGKMANGSVLINISRGKILDEKALINNHRKFLGIALDVFENEPLNKSNPLWELDNIYISPHNSWISEMRNTRRFEMIYENMKLYIDNQKIKNKVNLKRGY